MGERGYWDGQCPVGSVMSLSKGMQDAEYTDFPPDEAVVMSQELCGGHRGLNEQIIEKGLMAASRWAQRSGEGDGEHECNQCIFVCLQLGGRRNITARVLRTNM